MPALPTWFLRPFFANERLFEEHRAIFRAPGVEKPGRQMYWVPRPTSEAFDEDFVYNCDALSTPSVPWALAELSDISADQAESWDEATFLMVCVHIEITIACISSLFILAPQPSPPFHSYRLLS